MNQRISAAEIEAISTSRFLQSIRTHRGWSADDDDTGGCSPWHASSKAPSPAAVGKCCGGVANTISSGGDESQLLSAASLRAYDVRVLTNPATSRA